MKLTKLLIGLSLVSSSLGVFAAEGSGSGNSPRPAADGLNGVLCYLFDVCEPEEGDGSTGTVTSSSADDGTGNASGDVQINSADEGSGSGT